ncbi:MAG: type III-B CRISPR module RAMP protein Cmr4 [Chloroflexi bacterium]|nr:type III-B CRISPR module RAMP protein Cmr4 [Chloroflexota bacterium]
MSDRRTLLYFYAETPLHAGVGQQTDAAVDLPIQREEATAYPVIRASSLKGSLCAVAAAQRATEEVSTVFGSPPEAAEADRQPSALVLGDALTLLFPVRSLVGVFAWVTSSAVLARWRRDAANAGLPLPWVAPGAPADGEARVAPDSRVREPRGRLTMEDLTFRAQVDPAVATLGRWLADRVFPADAPYAYWREKVPRDLVLLPEEAYRFLVTHSTEVTSRIRIDPRTGAAAEGALWTEESLPADTLLCAPLAIGTPTQPAATLKTADEVARWLRAVVPGRFQLGGSRTLGRGFVRARWGEDTAGGTT